MQEDVSAVGVVDATTHVTLLFTDIEASTRTWEDRRTAMSLALARHDELLQAAVQSNGGAVFKHTGDGICAAFTTAPAAVAAAVAAQRALQAEDWSETAALRVRMALHTGAVEPRDADFFGPPLNRTARLLGTAHGGQTILSLVTAELLRDELPPGAGLVDLGEHRLADLSRPERVFQLTHPDLPVTFPPLRSLSTRRHNLPVATSSFVGREQELAAVSDLVRSSRLVTLIGMGGVGKTRLALQTAAGLLDDYPDGVFLVDLAPLADSDLVASRVARAIGLVEAQARGADESEVDNLCAHLGERRMLLLFDNCEHLIEAVAQLTHEILARSPEIAILATSREPLAVAGEILWRVPVLSMSSADVATGGIPSGDAVSLFCERARAVASDFTLTPANADAVTRICRRLDGIPLAMELAAARIGVLSSDQIADRLDDCFRLLSAGPRTSAARQQTFRATMDWSYELLAPTERRLLQRLAVFAGSFDLSAVEGVAADGSEFAAEDILDLLAHLVDKSLVSARGQGREAEYRLLETVRQYAAEKLGESGAEEEVRRRHRDYFLSIARTYLDGDPFSDAFWLVRYRLSYDNLRAALEWSLARGHDEVCLLLALQLSVYWVLGGYFAEGRARLEEALAMTGGSRTKARMRALNMLGFLVAQQGEMDHSLALHQEALTLAREADDASEAGVGAFYVGARVLHQGDVERADELLRQAIENFRSVGLTDGMAWGEMMLGWVAIARGDRSDAGRHFEASLELARPQAGNLRAHALGGAALLAADAGDGERAERLATEGIEAARELGLQTILVMTLTRAAEVGLLLGRWDWAGRILLELFTVLRNTGGRAFLADALEMAALLQDVRGDPQSAGRLFGTSDWIRQESNETPDERPLTALLNACRSRLAAGSSEDVSPNMVDAGVSPWRDPAAFTLGELQATLRHEQARRQPDLSPGGTPVAIPALFRREGQRWLLGFGDHRFELPDARGLGYLCRLVAEPEREIHVLDLVGSGSRPDRGHAGPVLDERAKSAYRKRLRDLQEDLEEARSWNDSERAARLEAEFEALTGQLAAGVGLGGRNRNTASAAERARVSVRKAIAASVAQIRDRDPDLGLLLATTVRTGAFCRYSADPRLPVTWEL